jgi:hypothetical protein
VTGYVNSHGPALASRETECLELHWGHPTLLRGLSPRGDTKYEPKANKGEGWRILPLGCPKARGCNLRPPRHSFLHREIFGVSPVVTAIPITIVSAADRQASPETIDFVASRMLQFYKSTNNFTTKHLIQEVSGSN